MTADRSTSWPIRRGLAAGLALAGSLVLLWGAWVAAQGPIAPAPARSTLQPWTVVLVAGLVLVAVLRALDARRRASRQDGGATSQLGVSLLVATAALAALAGWLVWAGIDGLVAQSDDGFAGGARVAVAAGSSAILLALIVGARSPRATSVSQRRGLPAAAAVLGVAVVLAGSVPVAASTGSWGLTASTAAPAPVPAVPATVRRVAWSTATPGGLESVVAAGPGVVAATTGGTIEAIDGRTGRVRWSYRRTGTSVGGLQASAGGGEVAAVLAPSGGPASARATATALVFDATTGRVVATIELPDLAASVTAGDAPIRLAGRVLVAQTEPAATAPSLVLSGYALQSGRRLWSTVQPETAEIYLADSSPIADGNLLLDNQRYGSSFIEAIDPETGALRWRTATPAGGVAYISPDGRIAATSTPTGSVVLATATGRIVARFAHASIAGLPDGRVVTTPGRDRTATLDLATGRTHPGSTACAVEVTPLFQPIVGSTTGAQLSGALACPAAPLGPTGILRVRVEAAGRSSVVTADLGGRNRPVPGEAQLVAAPGVVVAFVPAGGATPPSPRLVGLAP